MDDKTKEKAEALLKNGCWFIQPDARNGLFVTCDFYPHIGSEDVLVMQQRWAGDDEEKELNYDDCYLSREEAEAAFAKKNACVSLAKTR